MSVSTLSVVECGPPRTPREGSYPQLKNRTKIAKGCRLTSVTRLPIQNSSHSFSANVCPVKGSSLLCIEPTREYTAPRNTPRDNVPSPRRDSQNEKSVPSTPELPPDDDLSLSIVGERFNSLSRMSTYSISRMSSCAIPSRAGTSTSIYKTIKDPYTLQLSYDDSDEGELDGPPPTPSECSLSSFKLDGLRIQSVCEMKCTQSNRDFNPGYVKRTSYCCDKCADRMTCHESLALDSSPYYSYQKATETIERCRSQYTPLPEDLQGFLEPSVSLEEQLRRCSRLWGNKFDSKTQSKTKGEETVEPSPSPNIECTDSRNTSYSASCKVCVLERQQEEITVKENVSDAPPEEILQEPVISKSETEDTVIEKEPDLVDLVHETPEQTESSLNKESAIHAKESVSKEETQEQVPTNNEEEQQRNTAEDVGFWSGMWKPNDTSLASPVVSKSRSLEVSISCSKENLQSPEMIALPEISIKTRPFSGDGGPDKANDPTSEMDRNSNTCDDSPAQQKDQHPPVYDREKVKQVLQECADIVDIPKRQFLPELPTVPDNNDLCYTPIVDKRYNRWKRRRRKRNKDESGYRTLSPCESSSEENKDIMLSDSPPINVKLRRRRRLPDDDKVNYRDSETGNHSHDLHYDGSCELTSSDKDFNNYTNFAYMEDQTNAKDSIEEHQERIRAAIEQRAKEALQQEMFGNNIPHNNKNRKQEDILPSDLVTPLLCTTAITRPKNDQEVPTPVNDDVNLKKTMPKLPTFIRAKKASYARKTIQFQENEQRCFKPIDRSLVFHAASDAGTVLKLTTSNPAGDSSSGLVRVRMDKSSKERLLLSRMARHKVAGSTVMPRKRPVSEVTLPTTSNTNSTMPTLSLNKLLQTMPSNTGGKNKLAEMKESPKKPQEDKVSKQDDKISLTPDIVGLQKKHPDVLPAESPPKKQLTTRKCTFPKKPLLDMVNKAYLREIEFKVRDRDIGKVRNISSLSFTPSFSYSLFELPEIYKKYNKEIERRVAIAWSMSEKLK